MSCVLNRDVNFYTSLLEECLTPEVALLLRTTLVASVEAAFKQRDITQETFDPVLYHTGVCYAIAPEFYSRMKELAKANKLPEVYIANCRAKKNRYPYTEYVLRGKLIFQVKKSTGEDVPGWSSFRENRSYNNQTFLFKDEDIPEMKRGSVGLPFALLTYDITPSGLKYINFGFPRSRSEGMGWIGKPCNLFNFDLETLQRENVPQPRIEFNKEALRLIEKSS